MPLLLSCWREAGASSCCRLSPLFFLIMLLGARHFRLPPSQHSTAISQQERCVGLL